MSRRAPPTQPRAHRLAIPRRSIHPLRPACPSTRIPLRPQNSISSCVDTAGAVTVVLLVGAFGLAGAMGSIAATTIMELAPANRRGGALGYMNAVVTTAGLIAPTLIGSLVDTHGAGGYRYAVMITGALLLVGGTAAVTLINPDRDARLLSV